MTDLARRAIGFLLLVVVFYAAICGMLFAKQRSMIYFPPPQSRYVDPAEISLDVDGVVLRIVSVQRRGPKALIYFGGNAEDVSYSLDDLTRSFPDHAIYLMNYRGYGGSAGKPSETALVTDALALFDKVHAGHPEVLVVGRSLGSGVAVQLASQRPVSRLVLVTPFYSLQEVAERQFPWAPIRWLMLDKFESWRYVGRIAAPTLLVAAERDEIIPQASTEALRRRFRQGVASLRVMAGANHNDISENSNYLRALQGLP